MRVKNSFLLLILFFLLRNVCYSHGAYPDITKDIKVDFVKIKTINDSLNLFISIKYPKFTNNGNKWGNLSLTNLNSIVEKLIKGFQEEIVDAAKKRTFKVSYSLIIQTKTVNKNKNFISIQFNCNEEGIGPKLLSWTSTINYDLETKQEIKFDEIFLTDKTSQKKLIILLNSRLSSDCKIDLDKTPRLWKFLIADNNFVFPLSAEVDRICELPTVTLSYSEVRPFLKNSQIIKRLF